MVQEHDTWRDLILASEDLAPEERARAESHLAECAGCRGLLARLHQLEGDLGPHGALPPLGAAPWRSAAEERAATASRAALRAHLGIHPPAHHAKRLRVVAGGAGGWRPAWLRLALPLAAAATVVLLVLSPRPGREAGLVRDLQLLPYSGARGGRSGEGVPPAWHTGDAFVLRFELEKPAHPVVFHLDAAGRAALLHPPDPAAPIARMPAGTPIELPPPESASEWTFDGEPGPETFLVAASRRADLPLAGIAEEAAAATSPMTERETRVRAVKAILESRVGAVQVIEATHLP